MTLEEFEGPFNRLYSAYKHKNFALSDEQKASFYRQLENCHRDDFRAACLKAPSIYLQRMPNAEEIKTLALDSKAEREYREKQKEKEMAHKIINDPGKLKFADPIEEEWASLCMNLAIRIPKPKRLVFFMEWCAKHEEWVGKNPELVERLNQVVA